MAMTCTLTINAVLDTVKTVNGSVALQELREAAYPPELWTRFFPSKSQKLVEGSESGPVKRGMFELLPSDIIVDEIMSRLDIKALIRLRQTNKVFHFLSREPAIWKRFLPYLHTIPQPLPCVPPSAKFTAQHLAARDIETVVKRGISLDINWRSKQPTPYSLKSYETYHQILEMTLLPGSHYMIASVTDRTGKYAIILFAMDHPAFFNGGPVPLVIRHTEVKAYNLKARYLDVCGVPGIAVSFLRKKHKEKGDTRHIPETLDINAGPEIEDPYMPLKYECTVLHITLQSLDALTHRRLVPGTVAFEEVARAQKYAFVVVGRIRMGTQLGVTALEYIQNEPTVIVLKRPNTLIFQNLNRDQRSIINLAPSEFYPDRRHEIWNFKVFPLQKEVFTFRHLERLPGKLLTTFILESFPIPEDGMTTQPEALESFQLGHQGVVSVSFCDAPCDIPDDGGAQAWNKNRPPPPVSIYLRQNPQAFIHLTMWPKASLLPVNPDELPDDGVLFMDQEGIRELGRQEVQHRMAQKKPPNFRIVCYEYKIQNIRYQRTMKYPVRAQVGEIRMIPGTHRALIYSIYPRCINSIEPALLHMAAYVSPEHGRDISFVRGLNQPTSHCMIFTVDENEMIENVDLGEQSTSQGTPLWPKGRSEIRSKAVAGITLNARLWSDLQVGMRAIAWDEDVGRICISTKKDGQLHIMDFSYLQDSDEVDNHFQDYHEKPLLVNMNLENEPYYLLSNESSQDVDAIEVD